MDQFQKIVMRLPERDATKTIQRLIKDYNINIADRIPLYCDEHNKFIGYLYITNNYLGQEGTCIICTEFFVEHFGKVYHQWNENTFLECCGIEVEKKKFVKCINDGGNYHLTEGKEYEVINENICYYDIRNDIGMISGYYKDRFEIVNQENKNMSQKLIVPTADVLIIHQIACPTWQELIAGYLSRTDNKQMIKFTQSEVDRMFTDATAEQKPVLEEIFGKQSKPIDWDRIKTGSRVMIKHNSQHVEGLNAINLCKPVDVVFFKTPHLIHFGGKFKSEGEHSSYCTFHQDGKYAMFGADINVNYITEVIEY